MKKLTGIFIPLLFVACTTKQESPKNISFTPKAIWNDTDGNPINAHGGGIMYHDGTYYWYGE